MKKTSSLPPTNSSGYKAHQICNLEKARVVEKGGEESGWEGNKVEGKIPDFPSLQGWRDVIEEPVVQQGKEGEEALGETTNKKNDEE